jgi:hypothetical protein
VSEPDIEKKRKKRRRSARVYINANRPLAVPLDEIAAHFPADDADDDGNAEKGSTTMGNPHQPGGRSPADARVSPSRVVGGQAPSTGDHGASADPMRPVGPRELAWRHPDVRQSNVSFNDVVARLRTAPPEDASRAITYCPGEVALSLFNARGQAGSYPGMQPVGHAPQRPDYGPARQSGTPPNGSHSTANANRPPTQAMKGSEALSIMKAHLFGGSGGGR